MDPQIQNKSNKFSIKKAVIISLLGLIILSLAFTCFSVFRVLDYDKIYKAIYINGINAGGMTKEEITDLLKRNYQDAIKDKALTIKSHDNKSGIIPFSDINVVYDIEETVNKAYGIGRTGSIINRLSEILKASNNEKKVDIIYTFDQKKASDILEKLHKETLKPLKEADLLIQQDKIILISGHSGKSMDKEATLKKIDESIKLCKADTIEAPTIVTAPKKISVEEYYKRISHDAVDATFKSEGKTYALKPHSVGTSIDKTTLANIINEMENKEDAQKVLPVIFTQPKVTLNDLDGKLFKDTLATSYTTFSTNTEETRNRSVNIKLAASKINGLLLGPGDVFSFNDIVGERTSEGGYQEAPTYVAGKVVDGIGGGICQVSTTLYNAVLFSDLQVLARTNHYFPVSYVPLGRDAAVSYGGVDLKFKNNTGWPLKIEVSVSNNRIDFKLRGTKESVNKQVIINTTTTKVLDVPTKYIDDPKSPVGTEKVLKTGSPGSIVDTYKVVKIDNKVVSEAKIHTSYYHPHEKEISRGTRKDPNAKVSPTSKASPTPTSQGITPTNAVDIGSPATVDDTNNPTALE